MKTILMLGLLLSLSISCTNKRAYPQPPPADSDDEACSAGGSADHAACLREGEEAVDLSARFPGELAPVCCEGLDRIFVYDAASLQQGQCIVSKAERIVCARCGDGECGPGENRCNCSDCS
jgi:hypothetical protein